jgi:hypothetical protein
LKRSTLVSIAVFFLVGSALVVWICYASFKSSVMSFEETNAPAQTVSPTPTRRPLPVVVPTDVPTQPPEIDPLLLIPTQAPTAAPSTPGRPHGIAPPDA